MAWFCKRSKLIQAKLDGLLDLSRITNRKLKNIMALVSVEQDELDSLGVALAEVATSLSDKIDALIAADVPLPAGSLDGLKADLASLQSLVAPAAVPVDPTA